MRVVAGLYKGRALKGPKHAGLRPTADRVKEALFNIIGAKVIDADFLDLFAGSGAIGIEAISRGANSVIFVDNNKDSLKLVNENVEFLKTAHQVRVLATDAARAIPILAAEGRSFDIIFLDPPFQAGIIADILLTVVNCKLLKTDGWLIAEHSSRANPELVQLPKLLERTYGEIGITIWHNPNGLAGQ